MNFEKLASNYEGINENESDNLSDEVEKYKKAISRRDLLENAIGAFISSVSLGGIYFKNKENGIADASGKLDDIEKRIDRLIDVMDEEKVISSEPEVVETQETQEIIEEGTIENNKTREVISSAEFKKIKPELSYAEIHPAIKVENFKVPGGETKWGASTTEGKMTCTMVYKEITDAVEDRYNLPSGILLAMIMEESTGIDLLPNGRGDGGFGLSHMQGSVAAEYGLKTFNGCNALVCNSHRGCKDSDGKFLNHAKQLAILMEEKKDDRKTLVDADERLHLILNIDAAGRMLAAHMSGPKLKGKFSHLGPFRTAIARYAGSVNFEKYWEDICKNMKSFDDSNVVEDVAAYFNEKNPNLMVNGQHVDYYGYLAEMKKEFENYGLTEYKKLPKYNPANSQSVKDSYREFL